MSETERVAWFDVKLDGTTITMTVPHGRYLLMREACEHCDTEDTERLDPEMVPTEPGGTPTRSIDAAVENGELPDRDGLHILGYEGDE